MASYQILTDATADLTEELMAGLPYVEIVPMQVEMGNTEYKICWITSDEAKRFYDRQRNGQFASTSQINPSVYYDHFKFHLERGKDILYLSFSSGMSATIYAAQMAIVELQEEFPNRKIVFIDTLCASAGQAFLVREAAKKQADGMELKELVLWIDLMRKQVCHWFTVDTFEHLKHGGRVSAASASLGTVLNIKPLLRLNQLGALEVVAKPRGNRKAMELLLNRMDHSWKPEISPFVIVGHGDCPERAEELRNRIHERFPEAEIMVTPIGPVIGAHTGPGMLAVIFWGDSR